jgi:hypothetical protein
VPAIDLHSPTPKLRYITHIAQTPSNVPVELTYAPAPRWHQRLRFRRLLRRAVIVILILFAAYWGRTSYYWVRYRLPVIMALRHARRYTPPTTQHVVYDDDPQTYPQLLASGGGYASNCATIPGTKYAVYETTEFTQFVQAQSGSVYKLPLAFLHELTSPTGNRRVVAVQLAAVRADSLNRFLFAPNVMDAPFKPPPALPVMSPQLTMYRASGAVLRVYDGQVDPNDASRFVFVVQYNGQRIDVQGQLRDDDKVILTPAIGQLADFRSELAWIPPGGTIPQQYEPSCFVNIATTRPTEYLMSPRGLRVRIDDKGKLVREFLRSGTTTSTTAPALPY